VSAWRCFRILAAMGLLTVVSLVSSGITIRQAVPLILERRFRPDPTTSNEARLAGIRGALPAHGVVGYLASASLQKAPESARALEQFYATQYSLAPLIVLKDAQQPLVVANVASGTVAQALTNYPQLVPLRDFGHGVVLLKAGES
jgi:hypothetical protein